MERYRVSRKEREERDFEIKEKLVAIKQVPLGYLVVVIERNVVFLCPAGLAPASHPVKPVGTQRVA